MIESARIRLSGSEAATRDEAKLIGKGARNTNGLPNFFSYGLRAAWWGKTGAALML
jgi:hypothetical protein